VYLLDRLSTAASLERQRQQSPEVVSALVAAAKTGSALRRNLVAAASYHQFDRRGTWAQLTTSGVALRCRVEAALAELQSNDRPRGVVWGIRGIAKWDDPE